MRSVAFLPVLLVVGNGVWTSANGNKIEHKADERGKVRFDGEPRENDTNDIVDTDGTTDCGCNDSPDELEEMYDRVARWVPSLRSRSARVNPTGLNGMESVFRSFLASIPSGRANGNSSITMRATDHDDPSIGNLVRLFGDDVGHRLRSLTNDMGFRETKTRVRSSGSHDDQSPIEQIVTEFYMTVAEIAESLSEAVVETLNVWTGFKRNWNETDHRSKTKPSPRSIGSHDDHPRFHNDKPFFGIVEESARYWTDLLKCISTDTSSNTPILNDKVHNSAKKFVFRSAIYDVAKQPTRKLVSTLRSRSKRAPPKNFKENSEYSTMNNFICCLLVQDMNDEYHECLAEVERIDECAADMANRYTRRNDKRADSGTLKIPFKYVTETPENSRTKMGNDLSHHLLRTFEGASGVKLSRDSPVVGAVNGFGEFLNRNSLLGRLSNEFSRLAQDHDNAVTKERELGSKVKRKPDEKTAAEYRDASHVVKIQRKWIFDETLAALNEISHLLVETVTLSVDGIRTSFHEYWSCYLDYLKELQELVSCITSMAENHNDTTVNPVRRSLPNSSDKHLKGLERAMKRTTVTKRSNTDSALEYFGNTLLVVGGFFETLGITIVLYCYVQWNDDGNVRPDASSFDRFPTDDDSIGEIESFRQKGSYIDAPVNTTDTPTRSLEKTRMNSPRTLDKSAPADYQRITPVAAVAAIVDTKNLSESQRPGVRQPDTPSKIGTPGDGSHRRGHGTGGPRKMGVRINDPLPSVGSEGGIGGTVVGPGCRAGGEACEVVPVPSGGSAGDSGTTVSGEPGRPIGGNSGRIGGNAVGGSGGGPGGALGGARGLAGHPADAPLPRIVIPG